MIRRLVPAGVVTVSGVLTAASRWSADHDQSLAAGLLLIAALGMSAFVLLGPRLRAGQVISGIALVLFLLQLDAVVIVTIHGVNYYAANPVYVLRLIAFGLCGLGALLCVAVTWLPAWPFAEPAAIGVAALALGSLCLPGVADFTRTVSYPFIGNSAILFSNAGPGQRLGLEVDYDNSFNGTPQYEGFQITNPSRSRDLRWVLVVNGSQDLRRIQLYAPGIRYHLLTQNGHAYAQVFTGVAGRGTFESFSGYPAGQFADYSSDQAAVTLPTYASGLGIPAGQEGRIIVSFLHRGPPLSSTRNLTISVTAGPHLPFESLTDSSPPPDRAGEPGTFEWLGRGQPLAVRYAVTIGTAASSTDAALFTFSILLGVAGAALMASLQGTIRAFARRRQGSQLRSPRDGRRPVE